MGKRKGCCADCARKRRKKLETESSSQYLYDPKQLEEWLSWWDPLYETYAGPVRKEIYEQRTLLDMPCASPRKELQIERWVMNRVKRKRLFEGKVPAEKMAEFEARLDPAHPANKWMQP